MSILADVVPGLPPMVVGPELGVAFPTSIEALYTAGPDFLTAAFHAAGAIAADNRVTAITKASEFFGGGMGRKLWLDVDYAHHQPGLHRELFVKFPRDFGDPLRDLFAPLMAPEVRFALLSRRPNFPIEVARCYFADYEPVTKSGLLITQRIAFGKGEIERALDKCCDAELADSLPYYRAMTRAMATLAAHHQSGKLGNLDQSFPYRPDEDVGARIPFPREALAGKIAALRALAETAPGLFQDKLGDRLFLDQFAAEAELAMANEDAIRAFLARNSDLVALCHWNMNIDNAWFRRDSAGALHVGLLDWGSVGQMNLGQAFFGMTCAAEIEFMNRHRGNLLTELADTYEREGGPVVSLEEFDRAVKLSTALLGLAWIVDAPAVIEQMAPDYATASDRCDPIIRDNFLARAQLQILMNFLNAWRSDRIGEALRKFAAGNNG